jgi:hypothetical protein
MTNLPDPIARALAPFLGGITPEQAAEARRQADERTRVLGDENSNPVMRGEPPPESVYPVQPQWPDYDPLSGPGPTQSDRDWYSCGSRSCPECYPENREDGKNEDDTPAPKAEPSDVRSALIECERWLDGVRQSRDRDRFEKRWNTLQDEAAWLAHIARKVLAAQPGPLSVDRTGNITGTLPCGHPAKQLDIFEGSPYCPACWNSEPEVRP